MVVVVVYGRREPSRVTADQDWNRAVGKHPGRWLPSRNLAMPPGRARPSRSNRSPSRWLAQGCLPPGADWDMHRGAADADLAASSLTAASTRLPLRNGVVVLGDRRRRHLPPPISPTGQGASTVTAVTLALSAFASSRPCRTALCASSERSVGRRMCFYIACPRPQAVEVDRRCIKPRPSANETGPTAARRH